MHDTTKARMIIGGPITHEAVEDLVTVLAQTDLWIADIDEDETAAEGPESADNAGIPVEDFWMAQINDLICRRRPMILTVDDEYYDHDQRPPNSTHAFEELRHFCHHHGLSFRLRTAGGVTEYGDRHNREVETYGLGDTYRAYISLCGSMICLGINEQTINNPEMLQRNARHAWIAANWPIPPLVLIG